MPCVQRPPSASILVALSELSRMVRLIPGPSLRFSPTPHEASSRPIAVICIAQSASGAP
jgi:hypothetical protein